MSGNIHIYTGAFVIVYQPTQNEGTLGQIIRCNYLPSLKKWG